MYSMEKVMEAMAVEGQEKHHDACTCHLVRESRTFVEADALESLYKKRAHIRDSVKGVLQSSGNHHGVAE